MVNSSIYLATAHILAASLFPAEEVTSKFMRYIDIKEHVTDMWVDVLGELIEEPATNRSALCLNAALVCRKPRKFVTNFPDIDLGAHTKAYLAIFAPSAAISETVI